MKYLFACFVSFWMLGTCCAQPVLIEEKLDRTQGILNKTPVFMRSLVWLPEEKTDTVVLFFNGWPAIARIENDKSFFNGITRFVRVSKFLHEGIAIALMDCPTDQWGDKSWDMPNACDDSYRSAKQHLQDVDRIIQSLRQNHGLKNFYVMGHSHGTISAKLVSRGLSSSVSGLISSAAVTLRYKGAVSNFGWAGESFDMAEVKVPTLNIHHQDDGCGSTPYATVQKYAKNNLITVKGGVKDGPVCGGGHFHSYQGNELELNNAIIRWIKTREVTATVGDNPQ